MRARQRWALAVKRVRWLLRIRRLWAAVGQYLQRPSVLSLTLGLERRQGLLVRVLPAEVAFRRRSATPVPKVQPKAKGRVRRQ